MMVLIGGITRLTHSGLSMVKWEPIMGTLPPLNEQEWQTAFEMYKATPEFEVYNQHFDLDDFKGIFFWEYVHRLLARIIGLVFIVPFLIFWFRGVLSKSLKNQLIVLFVLGGLQGLVGWLMVKSGLVDKPYVSHYRLAIHFMLALFVMAYIYIVYYRLKENNPTTINKQPGYLRLFGILLILQLIYGAFVAGLKAGLIYNTYPLMGRSFFPTAAFEHSDLYSFYLSDHPGLVQFIHRNLAHLLLVVFIIMWFKIRNSYTYSFCRKEFNFLGILLGVQLVLGVLTLIYAVPVSLGVIHQFVAMLLFLATLNLILTIRFKPLSKK